MMQQSKYKVTRLPRQKQHGRKQCKINKSPSVVSMTSLPSGSTPLGTPAGHKHTDTRDYTWQIASSSYSIT